MKVDAKSKNKPTPGIRCYYGGIEFRRLSSNNTEKVVLEQTLSNLSNRQQEQTCLAEVGEITFKLGKGLLSFILLYFIRMLSIPIRYNIRCMLQKNIYVQKIINNWFI